MSAIIYSASPALKYPFVRSYIRGAQIGDYESAISWVGNVATITLSTPFTYFHVFIFNPLLWSWNSNTYTLDYLLEDAYYTLPPLFEPVQTPVDIAIKFDRPGESPYLYAGIPGAPLLLPFHATPPSPAGWWSG